MIRRTLAAVLLVFALVGAAQANHGHHGGGGFGGGGFHHGGGGFGGGGYHHGGVGVYRPHYGGGWGGGYGGYRNYGWGGGYRNYGWGGNWGGYRNYGYGFAGLGYGNRLYYGRPFYRNYGYYNSWPIYNSYYSYPYYSNYSYPIYTSPGYIYNPYCTCGTAGYTSYGYAYNPTATTTYYANALPTPRERMSATESAIARLIRGVETGASLAKVDAIGDRAAETAALKDARVTLGARDTSKLLALGDDSFRAGRYREALRRYDEAVDHSPKSAESYFRQGHALVALARYDEANLAFRRAVDVGGDARRAGFRLDSLYGSKTDEAAHIEALAAHVLEKKAQPAGYFLLGVTLRYAGESEQADQLFRRAAELSSDPSYLAAFVPRPDKLTAPVSKPTDEI